MKSKLYPSRASKAILEKLTPLAHCLGSRLHLEAPDNSSSMSFTGIFVHWKRWGPFITICYSVPRSSCLLWIQIPPRGRLLLSCTLSPVLVSLESNMPALIQPQKTGLSVANLTSEGWYIKSRRGIRWAEKASYSPKGKSQLSQQEISGFLTQKA